MYLSLDTLPSMIKSYGVILYAGHLIYSTSATVQNPPLFVDFYCSLYRDHNSLSECGNPSGLTTDITLSSYCMSAVVGIECTHDRKCTLHEHAPMG